MVDPSCSSHSFYHHNPSAAVDWVITEGLVPYQTALDAMQARVQGIIKGEMSEAVWLLEHPPLLTAGTSAKPRDLINLAKLPVFETGRGGQYTYHGPGQRVAYVMLDLKKRKQDVRAYVCALEKWIINTLWQYHLRGHVRDGRVGVWVPRPDKGAGKEDKIAAIGIRLKQWVCFHGIALNIEPDLSDFQNIIPCGITDQGVTSFSDLGLTTTMAEVDMTLRHEFEKIFGASTLAEKI